MPIEGGCRCGAVRFSVDIPALPRTYCCHCLTCQTWSGSAFSQQAVVAESAITVTAGEPVVFELTNPSGFVSTQRACGACHTRLWNTNSARPGIGVVRAGSLDDSHLLEAVVHIWVKRKQPWIVIAEGVPTWDESAPPADFMAAMLG